MIYEYHDFSKADKAILREILSMGVQREIEAFLYESFPDHKILLEERFEDIREPYTIYE